MQGGHLLQSVLTRPQTAAGRSGITNGPWRRRGVSQRGEQIWEQSFDEKRRGRRFLATVLFDEQRGTGRMLFAADLPPSDSKAKIPGYVRHQARSFMVNLTRGRI